MNDAKVGDRVVWTGAADFGSREVRCVGIVVGTGYGVPFGGYIGTIGVDARWVEVGRAPAVKVLADPGQHGSPSDLTDAERTQVIEISALEPE